MFRVLLKASAKQTTASSSRRQFSSGHGHDDAAIAAAWKQRSLYALPALGVLAVYNVFVHMSHEHHSHDHKINMPYEKKLDKKYPWEPSECNWLDYECIQHHYEKATGKKGGH